MVEVETMDTLAGEIEDTIQKQRDFFHTQRTLDVGYRIEKLQRLHQALVQHETAILEALTADLGKSPFEGYGTELGFILAELRHTLRHLRSWAKPQTVPTPLIHFPSTSRIYTEPLGVVLIISPWNYPFQLTMAPLIAAIAAGNCAAIKPSRYSPQTSRVMEQILRACFEPEYISFFQGGAAVNQRLLATRFDHIFFTGSTNVGRVVMHAAANHLTPVTLELGGKSPCIVDRTANIDIAARRIVWGKCVAAGQTCVAPDYLLVQKEIKPALVERMQFYARQFYGDNPLANPEYPKIINQRHFGRLCQLMDGLPVIFGGRTDPAASKIELTLLDRVTFEDAIMKEEIFGPLLPVIEFERYDQVLETIGRFEKPLSLYLFTRDKAFEQRILSTVPFGGGCVNDTLVHLANPDLPFGGIGNSGFGSYHGHQGFLTFSHQKSILKKSDRIDIILRNPPFGSRLKLIKRIMS